MIENLKPLYNSMLEPVAKICIKLNIHPNIITITGFIISLFSAYFCATNRWYTAASLILIGSLMDGLDGLIARKTQKKTHFGAILDSCIDRLTEAVWLIGILLCYIIYEPPYYKAAAVIICIAIVCSFMVSYVRARCEGEGIECKKGFVQRSERIIFIIVCLFLGNYDMLWGLVILSVISAITFVQRLIISKK